MNRRRLSPSKTVTIGSMVSALTMLCLYAVAVLPGGHLPLYFLSSVFIYTLCAEGCYAGALLSFVVSSLLSILLLPNKLVAVAYILLIGHYGIFWSFLKEHSNGWLISGMLKLLYCDIFTALGVWIAAELLNFDFLAAIPFNLPVWLFVLACQGMFIILDLLYGLAAKLYELKFRNIIIPRR